jgi:hypothetical protein
MGRNKVGKAERQRIDGGPDGMRSGSLGGDGGRGGEEEMKVGGQSIRGSGRLNESPEKTCAFQISPGLKWGLN